SDPAFPGGAGGNKKRKAKAAAEFRDDTLRGDPPDFANTFHKPKIAIRSNRDVTRKCIRRRYREAGEDTRRQVQPPNAVSDKVREPDVAIRTGHDPARCARTVEGDLLNVTVRRNERNLPNRSFREPYVTIRARRNIQRKAKGGRGVFCDP